MKKTSRRIFLSGIIVIFLVSLGLGNVFHISNTGILNKEEKNDFFNSDCCNLENPKSSGILDENFNKMNCSGVSYTLNPPLNQNPAKITVNVDDVVSSDDTVDPGKGNELNTSHISTDRTYCYIIDTNSNNEIIKTEDFVFINETNDNDYWSANFSTKGIPEGSSYAVKVSFYSTPLSSGGVANQTIGLFTISHFINVSFSFDYFPQSSKARIVASTYSSYLDGEITDRDIANENDAFYRIKDNESLEVISEGNLNYEGGFWSAEIQSDSNTVLTAKSFAVLEFNITGMEEVYKTTDQWNSETKLSNIDPGTNTGVSDLVIYSIIGVIVGIIFIGGIFLYIRRQKSSLERSSSEDEEILEIVDISKRDLKKKRLSVEGKKKKKKKKKAKNVDNGDLIFDVPTWEVEEGEGSEEESLEESPQTPERLITLHCPSCNSWYEVEEFQKIECPKCSEMLEVAMWCSNCSKWFDVPEPTHAKCPICENELSFSK